MKRAVIMAESVRLTATDLDLGNTDDLAATSLKVGRDAADRMGIRKVLARTQNNLSTATKILWISRSTPFDLMWASNFELT